MTRFYQDGLTPEEISKAIEAYLATVEDNYDEEGLARLRKNLFDHVKEWRSEPAITVCMLPPSVRDFAPQFPRKPKVKPDFTEDEKKRIAYLEDVKMYLTMGATPQSTRRQDVADIDDEISSITKKAISRAEQKLTAA